MKFSQEHMSDSDLDQLFRDAHAAEGVETLFVPEFWTEMESMLPATNKRRLVPWYVYAASLFVVTSLFFVPIRQPRITALEKKSVPSESASSDLVATQNNEDVSASTYPSVHENSFSKNLSPITEKALNSNQFNKTTKQVEKPKTENMFDGAEELFMAKESIPNVSPTSKDFELEELNRLEPKFWSVTQGQVSDLDPLKSRKLDCYMELGVTLGQSPYLNGNAKRDLVGGAILGAGISKRIDQMSINFGLQVRMEGFGGLQYKETNFSADITRNVSVKQLYSIEFPLKFAYHVRKSEFGLAVVPGVQLFVHGKEQVIQNQQITREGSYTGKVEHSSTMSMEMGLNYYYHFNAKYSLGLKLHADVLRPLHTDYYIGKSASIPLNGQLILRRTF